MRGGIYNNMKNKIKCNVDTCEHNDKKTACCDLESITVSCTCKNDECCCEEETVCKSFKETKNKNK